MHNQIQFSTVRKFAHTRIPADDAECTSNFIGLRCASSMPLKFLKFISFNYFFQLPEQLYLILFNID